MKVKKQRTLAIFALAIALVATTVAYAVLQTSLNISGQVTRKGGDWQVQLVDVSTSTVGGGSFSTEPSASGTSLTFNAALNAEGDEVAVKFRVHNSGSLNAKMNFDYGLKLQVGSEEYLISYTEFEGTIDNAVTCGLYDDGGNVVYYDNEGYNSNTGKKIDLFSLSSGSYSSYYTIKCKYTNQASTDSNIAVKLTMNYYQVQ